MKIFNYILIALLLLITSEELISQSAVPSSPSQKIITKSQKQDSEITLRTIDTGKLKKYKEDPDFQYDRIVQYELTIWERIIEWIKNLLRTIFFSEEYADIADIILYAVMGLTIIVIIYFIYRTEIRNIFSKEIKKQLTYLEASENIHELNFDEMISKSLDDKNFRYAIRLTYLKLLKLLDSRGFINWRNDKTNREMINQIRHKQLNASLASITLEFENIWYGGLDIDEAGYKKYYSNYNEIFESLKRLNETQS